MRSRPGSLAAARVGRIVGRALRLRCPRCGRSPLYARYFRMHERCVACGLRYEREQGFFVGAIYINYASSSRSGWRSARSSRSRSSAMRGASGWW